jgi:hypothetical protein
MSEPLAVLAARAGCALEHSIQKCTAASSQNLGHLEMQAARDVQELLRTTVERGAQAKADATPPQCPVCQQKLTRLSAGHPRTFESRYGPITVQRARGYCKRCRKWRVPADTALGLEESAGYLSTCRKQGHNLWEAIQKAVVGRPFIPSCPPAGP